MKSRLTLFLSLSIFGVLILRLALYYIPRSFLTPGWSLPVHIGWLYLTAGYLILGSVFSAVVWFMFVRDAGDKIPPIVMLVLGLVGFIMYSLFILGGLPMSSTTYEVLVSPEVILLEWLYVAFGVAGLLTKRRAG